jgi:hypothetical protein
MFCFGVGAKQSKTHLALPDVRCETTREGRFKGRCAQGANRSFADVVVAIQLSIPQIAIVARPLIPVEDAAIHILNEDCVLGFIEEFGLFT